MNIAIIGIGSIGGTIAKKLVKAGHNVKVATAKGIDAVSEFAEKIGAIPVDIDTVIEDADVLILSIPTKAYCELPKSLWQHLADKTIVVDTANYYPTMRDANIAALDNGKPESVWVSEIIGRPVIKAFNMVLAHSLDALGKNKTANDRIAMLVAGDNHNQKQVVMQLVEDCGFEPVDNGNLANSWTQQPNSAGYSCDYTATELKQIQTQSQQTPESVRRNRDGVMANFAELTGGDFSHANVIKVNRQNNR